MMATKKVAHKKTQKLHDVSAETKGSEFSANWQGRIIINDPEKSMIARTIGLRESGEYALKVR